MFRAITEHSVLKCTTGVQKLVSAQRLYCDILLAKSPISYGLNDSTPFRRQCTDHLTKLVAAAALQRFGILSSSNDTAHTRTFIITN
jgi:hypothetical protein